MTIEREDASVPRMLVTATVYRDDEQVVSMVQQGVEVGIASETKRVQSSAQKETGTDEKTTSAGGSGGLSLLGAGKADGHFERSIKSGSLAEAGGGNSDERTFTHTAAGQLHRVLTELGNAGLIRTVSKLQEAKDVQVGDFVEFRASFRPNEIASILEVLTPEVAGEISRRRKRAESLTQLDGVEHGKFQEWLQKRKLVEDSAAELTELVIRAVRADLRSDQTREYHARVEGARAPLTAVVVCEAAAFITADPDRLLDGHFTVVGKVISSARKDVSVFARSRLLARIQPEAIDTIQELVEGVMGESTTDFAGNEAKLGDVIDLRFSSRIDGWSFGVLPIAIYV